MKSYIALCVVLFTASLHLAPGAEPPSAGTVTMQAPASRTSVAQPSEPEACVPPSLNQPIVDPGEPSIFTSARTTRLYGGVDYLLWWVKGAPLAVPLVSTGPISTTHHGWLVNSDATILYGAPYAPATGGDSTQDFPAFSGGRLNLGYWLDNEQRFGIEGSGFLLQRRVAGYEIRSDSSGSPVINIPVYNTIPYSPSGRASPGPPAEDGLPASLPSDPTRFDGNNGNFAGGVKITNSLRLWGAEASGVINLLRTPSWELSALAGFRYLDLSETFHLDYDSTGVSGFYLGMRGALSETFQTRNQFYGGILGLRGRYFIGSLFVDLTGRVAMGSSHEVLNIWGGFYSINFTGPYVTGPEGVFAQPANEGRTSSDRFAVVPDVQLKLGYALTPRLRLTAGYDFLYYTNIVRPGDQLNRNLPKGQTFEQGGVAPSAKSPERLFRTTDFYAYGVSFGLDFRY